MKSAYILLALAVFGISARATELGVHDYDGLVSTLTNDILGKIDSTSKTVSSFLPDTSGLTSQLSGLTSQLGSLYDTYSSQFCTEASFDFGVKKPATFAGPAVTITFATGSCTFNETYFWKTGEKLITCVEPSITYEKTPAIFLSKRKTPITFTSKTCNISKSFGEETTTVLYSFDGSKQLDAGDISAKVTEEVKQALSSLTTSVADLPSSISDLVENVQDQGEAFVSGLTSKVASAIPSATPAAAASSPPAAAKTSYLGGLTSSS